MDMPPRKSLRKTASTPINTPSAQSAPDPVDDSLALTEEELNARSIRRTTREAAERGAVAQVAGTVGSVAVGALEGTITRLLKLLRLPIAIILGLVVVYTVSGGLGFILGIVTAFVVGLILSAIVNWFEMRAYRRKMN